MVKQILRKTIALFLVMVMTMGNVSLIGTNVYAAFEELEQQKTESSDKNVSFDTYFQVGNNRVHGVTLDAKQEAYVNFEVKVGNGFLKDSTISLNNANFEIESIEAQSIDGIVKKSTANTIELNQINSNKTVTISAKIKMGHPEYVETNYCQRETTATFVSNYTNIKGKENTINAQINVGISWITNELQTSIDSNVQKYMQFGNKAVIETKITSTLNENVLPIKNTNIKVTVPKVGENLPEEVRVHAISTKATNGITNGESFNADNWNYNSESGELTINVENTANQEGKVAWKNGTDEYIVTYIYETTETIPAIEIKAQNTITTYTVEYTEGTGAENQLASLDNANLAKYAVAEAEQDQTTPTETAEATPVTLSTGEGAILEASLSNDAAETVDVDDVITYTVKVKNTGSIVAENLKAQIKVPDGSCYVVREKVDNYNEEYVEKEDKTITKEIEKVEPGQTVSISFNLKAKEEKSIEVDADILNETEKYCTTNTVSTKIEKMDFTVKMEEIYTTDGNGGRNLKQQVNIPILYVIFIVYRNYI